MPHFIPFSHISNVSNDIKDIDHSSALDYKLSQWIRGITTFSTFFSFSDNGTFELEADVAVFKAFFTEPKI